MSNEQDWTPPHGIPRPRQEDRPGMFERWATCFVKVSMWMFMGALIWALIIALVVGTWRAVR